MLRVTRAKTSNETKPQNSPKKRKNSPQKTNTKSPVKQSPENGKKRKLPKQQDNLQIKRQKTNAPKTILVNGKQTEIIRIGCASVLKPDYVKLEKLRKILTAQGEPEAVIERTIQVQRRKSEKYLTRLKKQVCLNCRELGHVLAKCPNGGKFPKTCYKCGSSEHTVTKCPAADVDGYKFGRCVVCKKPGHLSRQCNRNILGAYPRGGACRICGDKGHMKKECPTRKVSVVATKTAKSVKKAKKPQISPGKKAKKPTITPGKKAKKPTIKSPKKQTKSSIKKKTTPVKSAKKFTKKQKKL